MWLQGPRSDDDTGRLCVNLDAGFESAERDAEAIRAWATEIAPVTMDVSIERNPRRAHPAGDDS